MTRISNDSLFAEWRAYQKLVESDYLGHAVFFNRLQEEVLPRFRQPISVLDLGCGDATPILPLLQALPVQHYVGIDESATALAIARQQLAGAGIPAQLVEGDLAEPHQALGGPFDLIVASFALHHLPGASAKQSVLKRCRQQLADGGLLAVIDVFQEEGEPRPDYLERWIAMAERRYLTLDQREKALLFDHVRARDFPESLNVFQRLGKAAGLPNCQVLAEDADGLNHLLVFSAA